MVFYKIAFGADRLAPPEVHIVLEVEGDQAGDNRFQEANRLSGVGDPVYGRLYDHLFGR